MPGRLTTHVLDLVHGRPAAGMAIAEPTAQTRLIVDRERHQGAGHLPVPLPRSSCAPGGGGVAGKAHF